MNPPLLDALLELKPNVIYTMAPPKAIASAAAYFAQDAVQGVFFRSGMPGDAGEDFRFLIDG